MVQKTTTRETNWSRRGVTAAAPHTFKPSIVVPFEPSQILGIAPGDRQAGLQGVEGHEQHQRRGQQDAAGPLEGTFAASAHPIQHQHRAQDDERHAGEVVVDERGSGHQHPGQELAGEADEHQQPGLGRAPPPGGGDQDEDQRQQARPPYRRVAHAGDGGDHALGHVGRAGVVPHRPPDHGPLVPGRAEAVGVAAQSRVVVQHVLLPLNYAIQALLAEHVPDAGHALVAQLEEVGEVVDQHGNHHEEGQAEQERHQRPAQLLPEFAPQLMQTDKQLPDCRA